MDRASPDVWKCFEDFIAGFAAARELHTRAAQAGSFVECVCLGASIADAMLRVGLVLKFQLDSRTRDIPLDLIFQGPSDKAIPERDIYRRAQEASVIDSVLLARLQVLYNDRNRVIHRYVISRITTSEVLDIASKYETVITDLSARIHALEERQIEERVGITVPGPSLDNQEGRRFLQEIADEKHTPTLAKLLRGS